MSQILFLCSGNYYRSRFAEALFNHHAAGSDLGWRAISAGLTPEHFSRNPGPISPVVVAALAERGIVPPLPHRPPKVATAGLLMGSERIVALKESEHRPLLATRFPQVLGRVTFWDINDLDVEEAAAALAKIEHQVKLLVEDLDEPG